MSSFLRQMVPKLLAALASFHSLKKSKKRLVLTLEANEVKWMLRFASDDSNTTIQLEDVLEMNTNVFKMSWEIWERTGRHYSREHRGVDGWLVWGRIFRPWHIRCRTGWGPPLQAVQAPVWWQTSRLGWTGQGESGLVTGHTDAQHPLCTLQCTETWWEKNIHVVHSTCWRKATDILICLNWTLTRSNY